MTVKHFEISKSYRKLLRRFPLRPIRDERDYHLATSVLQDLFDRELEKGQQDYLETLLLLVRDYEARTYDFDRHKLSPKQALKRLMEANDLKQSDIATIIGSQSAASMILGGERAISRNHAKALAGHFKVDVGLFL